MKFETNITASQAIKQITKRNPVKDEVDNYGLYLPPKSSTEGSGVWLDDSKTLEHYNLVEKVSHSIGLCCQFDSKVQILSLTLFFLSNS
jgi:hypothetical protein